MIGFRDAAEELKDCAQEGAELRVLIWGPGNPGEHAPENRVLAWKKRCLIRKVLRSVFPCSDIKFSEEIDTPKGDLDLLVRETAHAAKADVVIILDMSPGANVERDYFIPRYNWFRQKVFLLVPKQKDGDPRPSDESGPRGDIYRAIPDRQIKIFTKKQFDDSDVAKKISVDIVTTVALLKRLTDQL